jgi:hypothetical protein
MQADGKDQDHPDGNDKAGHGKAEGGHDGDQMVDP